MSNCFRNPLSLPISNGFPISRVMPQNVIFMRQTKKMNTASIIKSFVFRVCFRMFFMFVVVKCLKVYNEK
jgi:hypothetical protein